MTFEELTAKMNEIHSSKNSDYGDSFSKTLDEFGIVASATRMSDKFNRFKSLIKSSSKILVSDESVEDTLMDLACYSIMTIEWLKKHGV